MAQAKLLISNDKRHGLSKEGMFECIVNQGIKSNFVDNVTHYKKVDYTCAHHSFTIVNCNTTCSINLL